MWFYYVFLFLSTVLVPLVKMAMKAIGIGAVSYIGINQVLSVAKNYVISSFGNASPIIQAMLGMAQIDVFLNIILAAVTTRMTLAGLNKMSGKKKDFVLKA